MTRLHLTCIGLFFILTLLVSPVSSSVVDGYGGAISTDTIEQGETVRFTGSIHNYRDEPIFVFFMNVTFIEELSQDASRDPDTKSLSKNYETPKRQEVFRNMTFTDVLVEKIDYEPRRYLVSISFSYTNQTGDSVSPAQFSTVHSLVNASIQVAGTTQATRVLQGLAWMLGGITVVIVGTLIYRRYRS